MGNSIRKFQRRKRGRVRQKPRGARQAPSPRREIMVAPGLRRDARFRSLANQRVAIEKEGTET